MWACVTGRWNKVAPETIYDESLSHVGLMVVLTIVITIIIGFIVYKGVQSGIEAVSKVMVPLILKIFAQKISRVNKEG